MLSVKKTLSTTHSVWVLQDADGWMLHECHLHLGGSR